jgi:hypothetical protein
MYTPFFLAAALFGSAIFIFRCISLFFFNIDHHDHGDQYNYHDHDASESDSGIRIFTLHSLSGFFMVGGFVGLACTENYAMGSEKALLIAFVAGATMLFLSACMMHSILKLQHRGAIFSLEQTCGLIGTVYQEIPARGQGKIQITVNNRTYEILAQSLDSKVIESFTQVVVNRVVDQHIVEVQKISL